MQASPEQQQCVDFLVGGANVVVQASAGAGKSTTFYHAARAWLDRYPGTKIIQLCFNTILRSESQKRVAALHLEDSIDCFTIHALAGQMYQTCIHDTLSLHKHLNSTVVPLAPAQYSLCLLDEAQDLSELMMRVVTRLQQVLPPLRYMVVGDARQEIYNFLREVDVRVLDQPATYLNTMTPWQVCQLNTSYRLTPANCDFINHCCRHPSQALIHPGNMQSANVKPIFVMGDRDGDDLVRLTVEMLQRYPPEDIMILAPSVNVPKYQCSRVAQRLSQTLHIPIYSTHKSRVEVSQDMLRGKLFLSTFQQSKGYERRCVIVLGMDMESWAMERPLLDDQPAMHNALHVALTRAIEQLVIFQHFTVAAYPALHQIALPLYAQVRSQVLPKPKPCLPMEFKTIIRDDGWLVKFPSSETLQRLLTVVTVDPAIRMGPNAPPAPNNVVNMANNMLEDVWDYFPPAILAAVEHHMGRQQPVGERYLSTLERELLEVVVEPAHQLPASYRRCFQELKRGHAPNGPRSWLILAAMHSALVTHNFPHELQQLGHFNWVTEREHAYFTACVQNILSLVQRHPLGHFQDQSTGRAVELKTIIRATTPYCEWREVGMCVPWQFCFGDVYSEENLMRAVVHMWTFKTRFANVFCVAANQLYKLHTVSDQVLAEFVQGLISRRRNL